MSITHNTTIIEVKDYLELEELAYNMQERLEHYAKRHKDFSVVLEKNIEDNQLIIKTLYLEEHVN